MCVMVETGCVCVNSCFHLVKFGGFTWYRNHSCFCSSRNSAVVNWILNNWLYDCVMALGQPLLLKLES